MIPQTIVYIFYFFSLSYKILVSNRASSSDEALYINPPRLHQLYSPYILEEAAFRDHELFTVMYRHNSSKKVIFCLSS